jgi:hypothetical protein
LVAGAVLIATGSAYGAGAATVQSGWWNKASVGPVPGPSTASSGQLEVSDGLSGPIAISAVRVGLPSGTPTTWSLTLTLPVVPGSTVGTPAVSACPTTSAWTAGDDQNANTEPSYDCTSGHRVDGTVDGTNEVWTVPLQWALKESLAIALVPTTGTTTPFAVAYKAPTADSVVLVPPAPAPAPAPSSPPAATGGGSAGASGGAGALSGPGSAGSAGSVVSPSAPTGASASPAFGGGGGVAAAAPALGSIPASGAAGGARSVGGSSPNAVAAPAVGAAGSTIRSAKSPGRGGKVMAFGLLVATGLALFYVSAQPERAPRLLGSLGARGRVGGSGANVGAGDAAAGGLGRFARPRTAPPRRL